MNVNGIKDHYITFYRNSLFVLKRKYYSLYNLFYVVFFALHKMNKGRINITEESSGFGQAFLTFRISVKECKCYHIKENSAGCG